MQVIGYEGGFTEWLPLVWGAAAVRDERGVFNATLPLENQPRLTDDELRDAPVTLCEVEIPIDQIGPYYVADIDRKLASRAPYLVENNEPWRLVKGLAAIGYGPTRTYYVFKSHDRFQQWLYLLHAGPFALVPCEGP